VKLRQLIFFKIWNPRWLLVERKWIQFCLNSDMIEWEGAWGKRSMESNKYTGQHSWCQNCKLPFSGYRWGSEDWNPGKSKIIRDRKLNERKRLRSSSLSFDASGVTLLVSLECKPRHLDHHLWYGLEAQKAFWIAEAGLQDAKDKLDQAAVSRLQNIKELSSPVSYGGGSYTITTAPDPYDPTKECVTSVVQVLRRRRS